MSKKDKKCQCENHEQELNEECNCNHEECCCEEDCCCDGEHCGCENQDIDTSELLSKRISELNEALLRSQAELLNYKKRKDEETARILKYAEKDILEGFLPILDNFDTALSHESTDEKFKAGMEMIYNQIKDVISNV